MLERIGLKRIGLHDLFGIIVILGLVFLAQSFAVDPGFGWHLKSGEWIAVHGKVPQTDLFLAAGETKPWIHNQWFADLIFWKVFQHYGFAGLHLFSVGLLFAVCFLVLPASVSPAAKKDIALFIPIVMLLATLATSVQWFFRPVLLSFLFFAVVQAVLRSLVVRRGMFSAVHFVLFPLLFALWSNLHPAFVLGLGLLFVFACDTIRVRYLTGTVTPRTFSALLLLVLCSLATLCNPYGLELYRDMRELAQSVFFMNLNEEWSAIDVGNVVFLPFLGLLLVVLLFQRSSREISLYDRAVLFLFCLASLMQVRYVPFCAIVMAAPVCDLLRCSWIGLREERSSLALFKALDSLSERESGSTQFRYALSLFALIVLSSSLAKGIPGRSAAELGFPSKFPLAASEVLRAKAEARIFHTPNWGGFLTFQLWPETKVFIDDRNQVNGEAVYENFFRIQGGKPGWQDLLRYYQFDWVLLERRAPLRFFLAESSDWQAVPLAEEDKFLFQKRQ